MHRDDPLTQIRIHARLYGRNHARRVVRAVLHALQASVPETAFRNLAGQLPADLTVEPRDDRPAGSCRQFIHHIAGELHVDHPNAAFYARVTFEQLNAFCRGITPAGLAAWAPPDLRPLLTARADSHRRLVPLLGQAVAVLSLRAPATASPAPEPAGARANARSSPARRT